jgi:Bacterial membrane protein YfhO
MRRSALLIYLSLLVNAIVFFHKPLFSSEYLFPWDFRGVQLPLISFLTDELRQGRFALWNPYSYCGYPVFANIEACYFHPLILLCALIASHSPANLPQLLEWAVVLQVTVAGMFTYHFLRELDAGRAAAWAGAIIFETGGYFASRAEHIGAMMAVAWMPLAWLAVLKLRHEFRFRWFAALCGALGMSILGGFPQPTLAVFASTLVLAIFLPGWGRAKLRVVGYTLAACLLGISLAAIQFIPTFQLTQNSVAKYRAGWLGTGGGLLWQSLVSLLLPNHYNQFDMTRFKGPGDPSFLYLYGSVAGLFLAIFALVAVRKRSVTLLASMTAFGLIWMLGENTPIWRAVYPLLPVAIRIGIHPEYTYCIFCFGLAGLAAFGLQALPLKETWRFAIGLGIAADLFLAGSGRPMNLVAVAAEPGVTHQAFEGNAPLLQEMTQRIGSQTPPWRIDNTEDAGLDWAIQAPISGIPTANGVSPLALENEIQLRLFLHDGNPWGWYYPVEKPESPVLDAMNVKYVVTGSKEAERMAAAPRFRHVAQLPRGFELFENLAVMPRFFLVHDAVSTDSLAATRRLIASGSVDLHRTAITDRPVSLPGGGSAGEVQTLGYQPGWLQLKVSTEQPALLVLAESYYPGWLAWVDGTPAEIYRTDITFRGISVPAGIHTVRMEFRPAILPISIGVSAGTAALLGLLWWVRRRLTPPPANTVTARTQRDTGQNHKFQ